MAKGNSGRRAGSAKPPQRSIYGKTPSARVGGNSSQLLGKKLPGCTPQAHVIGAPRDKK